jgi:predicted alpha/beta superfamily hydrolase
MRIFFSCCFICLFFFADAQDCNSLVSIGKRDSIYSPTLEEMRPYLIHLPDSYTDSLYSAKSYPVLYLLDGEEHFNSVSGLVQILGAGINGTHVIPDMIVVAIPNTDRTRDLTPTHATGITGMDLQYFKTSGGNENFLNFLKNELLPHIDSTYRTMPYRVFVGHSFGGITVINAMYLMPEMFNAYIAIDPSLWWDNQVLLKKAKTYFLNADLEGRSLYLAQANTLVAEDTAMNEHFESIKEFSTILQTRNHSGLKWKYDFYDDDDHGSVPFISEYNGLRFIFDGYHVRFGQVYAHPDLLKEQFRKFSEETKVKFLPPEDVINSIGYNVMNSRENYDLAIQFFQMNIDYYPNSANVYDSMGEAWMNKGDNKKAIEYYEKSLKLNPQNKNAEEMIKQLKQQPKTNK